MVLRDLSFIIIISMVFSDYSGSEDSEHEEGNGEDESESSSENTCPLTNGSDVETILDLPGKYLSFLHNFFFFLIKKRRSFGFFCQALNYLFCINTKIL